MVPLRYLAGAIVGLLVAGTVSLLTYPTADRHPGSSTVLLPIALAAGILAAFATSAVIARVRSPLSSPRPAPSRKRYAAATLAFVLVAANVLALFPTNDHGRLFRLFALTVALATATVAFSIVTALGTKRPPR